MERKVIRLASKTLVVSLPSKWAQKYNIKKGDSVAVEESGGKLVIGQISGIVKDRAVIDISGLKKALVWRYITAAYVKGSDEIEVSYEGAESRALIQEIVQTLIGFAVIKEGKNSCVAKDLSGTVAGEFENILRRIFLLLLSMAEDGAEAAAKGNNETLLNIKYRDHNVNSFVNYCLRYLNKKGYSDFAKTPVMYSIIRNLEFLGDEYSRMYEEIACSKAKPSSETIRLIQKANEMLRLFYEAFYKFEKGKMIDLLGRKLELREKTAASGRRSPDSAALCYLHRICDIIFDLGEALLGTSL